MFQKCSEGLFALSVFVRGGLVYVDLLLTVEYVYSLTHTHLYSHSYSSQQMTHTQSQIMIILRSFPWSLAPVRVGMLFDQKRYGDNYDQVLKRFNLLFLYSFRVKYKQENIFCIIV
jgi:hypothetical protein